MDANPSPLPRPRVRRAFGPWCRATLLLLGLCVAPPCRAQVAAPPPAPRGAISLEEIRPGQRGYGLSVFSGRQPGRFEVEVLGVWRNSRPDLSYILARLSGENLEESGVISGMSGSPVYIDGRLAGAVAFSWQFAREPIAGITPIAAMRDLTLLPPPRAVGHPEPSPVELARLVKGELPEDLLERQLRLLAPRPAGLGEAVSGVQWVVAGFGELARGPLERALGNVVSAGRGAAESWPDGGAAAVEPGMPVAAVLISGDLSMAGTGTVTDRDGDELLAFGHPFLGLGPIEIPMAAAEVVTVVASTMSSFKVSNLGPVVGAFTEDRQPGLFGRLGARAPTVPLDLTVVSDAERRYHMELARLPQVLPSLMAVALLGGLESTSYSVGDQGIDLHARLRLAEHGELVVRQSFDGVNAPADAALHLLAIAGFLTSNPLEPVELEGVEVELRQTPELYATSLVGGHASRGVVHPGERLTLNLELRPYRGEPYRRAVEIEVPKDLPEGPYTLLAGDGASADAARLLVEPAAPVNFAQALRLLRSFHSRRQLVVLGLVRDQGLAVEGEVMSRLPASVRSLWSAAGSAGAQPLGLAIAQSHTEDAATLLDGIVRVDVEVRRRWELPETAGGSPAAPAGESSPAAPAGSAENAVDAAAAGNAPVGEDRP